MSKSDDGSLGRARHRAWHRILAAVRAGELGSLGRGMMSGEERQQYENEFNEPKDQSADPDRNRTDE